MERWGEKGGEGGGGQHQNNSWNNTHDFTSLKITKYLVAEHGGYVHIARMLLELEDHEGRTASLGGESVPLSRKGA